MKKVSFMLVVVMLLVLFPVQANAQSSDKPVARVLLANDDVEDGFFERIEEYNGCIYYMYRNDTISYCSQLTDSGKILFSYCICDTGDIFESDILDVGHLSSDSNSFTVEDVKQLNRGIRGNVENYTVFECLPLNGDRGMANSNDLATEIAYMFGSNYSGIVIDYAYKVYNGATYYVKCTEAQSYTYTSPNSHWFAADTALATIVSWAISSGWTWQGTVLSIVASVVVTILVNGVQRIINSFTAERTNVTMMWTRLLRVDGYSGSYCSSGWNQKWYFFKGDNGWTSDYAYNYSNKGPDYDYPSVLIDNGFSVFVDVVLLGL